MIRLLRQTAHHVRRGALLLLGPAFFLDTTAITAVFATAGIARLVEGFSAGERSAMARSLPVRIALLLWLLLAASLVWQDPTLTAADNFWFLKKYIELLLIGPCLFLAANGREAGLARTSLAWAGTGYAVVVLAAASGAVHLPLLDAHLDAYRVTGGFLLAFASCWSTHHLLSMRRRVDLVAAMLPILALLAQGARTGLAMLSVMGIFLLTRRLGTGRRTAVALLSVAAVLGAALLVFPGSRDRVAELASDFKAFRTLPAEQRAYTSGTSRLSLLACAAHHIKARPWTGYGAGTFARHYAEDLGNLAEKDPRWLAGHPHNEYLHLWFQAGPAAAGLFLLLLTGLWRMRDGNGAFDTSLIRLAVIGFAVSCLFNCSLLDWEEGAFFLFALAAARRETSS